MAASRSTFLASLSGRFLVLTVIFVMLAEVLIFVPTIARYREDFLIMRLQKAQIASLAQLAALNMVTPEIEAELLANVEVYNIVLLRDEIRQLVLSSRLPEPISQTYDMRNPGPMVLIRDALATLIRPDGRVIRVIGEPIRHAGLLIEITMESAPLREAMITYGLRILFLSALISAVTAFLLFLAVQRLIVMPIRRVVDHMQAYAQNPEDARLVIAPTSPVMELRAAEEAMQSMQTQLTGSLRQKERLAQLGGAVAKISHDLRNMLATAQLFTDRIGSSVDPLVARAAPKLVASIGRAVSLCESTLRFGRAEEPAPQLRPTNLARLVQEVIDGEGLAAAGAAAGAAASGVSCEVEIAPGLMIAVDGEHLYRVLGNLLRNARQAIEGTGRAGTVRFSAGAGESGWWIRVKDTGPGLPDRAREHLFEAFQGNVRKGGTGLGLAIAAELIRGHGGRLELAQSDAAGTEFVIHLPTAAT